MWKSYLSIGLNVSQQVNEGSGGLQWPGDLVASSLVLLCDGVATDSTSVLGEWDGFLELQYVLQVTLCIGKGASLDSLTNFTAVLEVDAEVGTTGLGSLGGVIWLFAVDRK